MNILLLEDKGVVAYPLKEWLEEDDHKVFLAPNISRAKTYWHTEKRRLGCIIADLNMDPEGLKPDEKKETRDGLLTGWIWLRNYVFAEDEEMRRRTIILTAYMNELMEAISDNQLEGIVLVEKDPLEEGASGSVLHSVKMIADALEERTCKEPADE